jgi:hypothetical protein
MPSRGFDFPKGGIPLPAGVGNATGVSYLQGHDAPVSKLTFRLRAARYPPRRTEEDAAGC